MGAKCCMWPTMSSMRWDHITWEIASVPVKSYCRQDPQKCWVVVLWHKWNFLWWGLSLGFTYPQASESLGLLTFKKCYKTPLSLFSSTAVQGQAKSSGKCYIHELFSGTIYCVLTYRKYKRNTAVLVVQPAIMVDIEGHGKQVKKKCQLTSY